MLVGAQIAGTVYDNFLGNSSSLTLQQWQSFWWIPAAFAVAVLILFILFFKENKKIVLDTEPKLII
jgi:hypothetical protein